MLVNGDDYEFFNDMKLKLCEIDVGNLEVV